MPAIGMPSGFGRAVDLARFRHARQDGTRHRENFQQLVVPFAGVDIEEHGAARVRHVGDVLFAAGQVPDQPRIDRAEGEPARVGKLPRLGHVLENPAELAAGKVGVDDEAGLFLDHLRKPVALELVAEAGGAAVLPDDGVADRLACLAVPDHGRLALVGDADGREVLCRKAGLGHRLGGDAVLRGPDFVGVMLDPAGLREVLLEFLLGDRLDRAGVFEDDGAGTGGALVEGEDVFHGERGKGRENETR